MKINENNLTVGWLSGAGEAPLPVLFATIILLTVPAVSALNPDDPVWSQESTFSDTTPEPDDEFGSSVALSGDTLVIGTPGEDLEDASLGFDRGKISIYERTPAGAWTPVAEFNGTQPTSRFGTTIAAEEDTIVASAPGKPTSTGCPGSTNELYVYDRTADGWQLADTLAPPDLQPHKDCLAGRGDRLTIDGDTIVASASIHPGGVWIFQRTEDGWQLETSLMLNETLSPIGSFGTSVDINEAAGVLAVGTAASGAVDVFERIDREWVYQARLTSDEVPYLGHGVEISDSGDLIISRGSAWAQAPALVWEKAGGAWKLAELLAPSDERDRDPYIASLSLDGDTLALGAWWDDASPGVLTGVENLPCPPSIHGIVSQVGPCYNGAVYIYYYEEGAWRQSQKLYPMNELQPDLFGWDVSLEGGEFAVGAPGHDGTHPTIRGEPTDPDVSESPDVGMAHVFSDKTTSAGLLVP